MTNSQRLAEVRKCLCDWLGQQTGGETDQQLSIQSESLLIVGGFYCGRRFDAGPYHAVWFMEEDELKIHSADGELMSVFTAGPQGYAGLSPADADEEPADVIALPERVQEDRAEDDRDEGIRRAA